MRNFEIIIGTYEEFLLGYKLDIRNDQPALIQTFADKSHSGSIKSVAVHGHWIATGATDDRIFIYDMRTRKQSQILLTHDGTINALAFTPDESHLLSGGDDGQMIATRIKTWLTEGSWKKAHNGSAVTHISCHPSGKLALSLGSDLVLRTWNLVKGRVAYKTNLKSRNTLGFMPDCLAWSTSGEYFSITGQRVVEIWTIKSADVIRSVKTAAKPVCLSWISDDVCLVGLEDGKILWLNINEAEEQNEKSIEAHDTRVKAMCFFEGSLVTASSAGEVKVWDVLLGKNKLKEVAATNVGCRPTCLSVLDLKQFGDDYVLTKTIKEYKEEPVKQKTPSHPLQRGIVQIEYENDDDEDDKIGNLSAEDKPNDDSDDDSEDDDDDSAAAQASSNDDNEDDDDDEDDHGDDEINHDREPQIRLPKSRKHKQLIQNTQIKAKKAKLEQKTVKKAKKNDGAKKSKSTKSNSPQKNILKQLGKAKNK